MERWAPGVVPMAVATAVECNTVCKASAYAFAAILADGAVVTWGDAAKGGDSKEVQQHLKKCCTNPAKLRLLHRNLNGWIGGDLG